MAANVVTSGNYSGLIPTTNPALYMSTRGLYVGSTYYFFSANDVNNTIGFISTTDLVNYTPFVQITPCAGLVIADVYYNSTTGAWYFLEANGTIISVTNLNTFAGLTYYYLPNLSVVNGYRKLTYLNSIWYAIGGSTTGTGYRISSSSNLTSWTTVIENTSAAAPATSICQGAGSGASTEILVGCSNDTTLKSTNNGTSFTATTSTTGLTSAIIKQVFYSARTGLYYLAVTATNTSTTGAYTVVSTTGTLATAAWTNYYSGAATNTSVNAQSSNIDIVDTGTNVGILFTSSGITHNFYYGASYNTASSNIMTSAQIEFVDALSTNLGTAKSIWLNGNLITIYANQISNILLGSTARSNGWLIVSSGATCTTGITTSLQFPNTNTYYSTTLPQSQVWGGVSYLGGSYYAAASIMVQYTGGGWNQMAMYLFKINSSFTTFSCPVPAVLSATTSAIACNVSGSGTNMMAISAGRLNSTGTAINWVGYVWSAINNFSFNFTPIFSFNGTSLTYVGNLPSSASSAGSSGSYSSGTTNLPGSAPSIPKWSSLYNAYVYASPCIALDSSVTTYSGVVNTNTTLTGTPSPLISFACGGAGRYGAVTSVDVLSNGMVLATGVESTSSYYVQIATGNTAVTLISTSSPYFGLWEIVYNGSSYLAVLYTSGSNLVLNVWKLNPYGPLQLIVNGYVVSNITLTGISPVNVPWGTPPGLRRVVSNNGSYFLADALAANTTSRNALMLTPNNGTFTISPVYLYIGSDYTPTGLANTYTTQYTVTSVNPTPVPAVFIPAGTANYFVKVR